LESSLPSFDSQASIHVNHALSVQRPFSTQRLRTNVNVADFEEVIDVCLSKPNDQTDIEIIDMLEQFFWGVSYGLALEMGVKNSVTSNSTLASTWLETNLTRSKS
jgi:hypothetical protein